MNIYRFKLYTAIAVAVLTLLVVGSPVQALPADSSDSSTGVGSIELSGEWTIVSTTKVTTTNRSTGEKVEGVLVHLVPSAVSQNTALATCSIDALQGTPYLSSTFGFAVSGYAELKVSAGCASSQSWTHKVLRGFTQVGGSRTGTADPGGPVDFDTRSYTCVGSSSRTYRNDHSWVAGTTDAVHNCS